MQEIEIDKLLNTTGSLYKLTILSSRRALELADGAASLVETVPEDRPADIALREVLQKKISWRVKEKK